MAKIGLLLLLFKHCLLPNPLTTTSHSSNDEGEGSMLLSFCYKFVHKTSFGMKFRLKEAYKETHTHVLVFLLK